MIERDQLRAALVEQTERGGSVRDGRGSSSNGGENGMDPESFLHIICLRELVVGGNGNGQEVVEGINDNAASSNLHALFCLRELVR